LRSDAYLVPFPKIEAFLRIEQQGWVLQVHADRMEVRVEQVDADLEIIAQPVGKRRMAGSAKGDEIDLLLKKNLVLPGDVRGGYVE
jgi:hypothetical protein